ncbi:cholecystokinin receptor type A-like [Liolophura sinensis]|uniref:cholecystokinin receptor type A-like n=1 Tax=Liolophura sinensis TaxID=3198878 RepID=UPI0031598E4D
MDSSSPAFKDVVESEINTDSSFVPLTVKDLEDGTTGQLGAVLNVSAWNVTESTPESVAISPALGKEILIPLYSAMFLLSLVGNTLVIVTLIQNKRMRTVTNVFLINLSVSDLLLALFCMPFTLIPPLMKNFIFGEAICVLIRYLQAVSVGVSCFTLVAISLERYFAICQPLKSRSWQTLSHSYKTIAICWVLSISFMIPIAMYNKLVPLENDRFACREIWYNPEWKKAYTILLDLVLLFFPVVIMSLSYGMIVRTLWMGIKMEMRSEKDEGEEAETMMTSETASSKGSTASTRGRLDYGRVMRQANSEKSRAAKKRVIKMLFAVVLEFFICWTPLYVTTTWIIFDYDSVERHITPMAMSFIYLLSYVSSCCNPITYCFMNRKFRQGFISAFKCCICMGRNQSSRGFMHSSSSHTLSTRTGKSKPRAARVYSTTAEPYIRAKNGRPSSGRLHQTHSNNNTDKVFSSFR